MKLIHATPEHLEKRKSAIDFSSTSSIRTQHFLDYEDLKDKPFFPGMIKYMVSGPVVATVWEGLDAVKTGRVMLGMTNPLASAPGQSFVAQDPSSSDPGIQEQSVVTMPSPLVATSAMVRTLLRTPRKRLNCISHSYVHYSYCLTHFFLVQLVP